MQTAQTETSQPEAPTERDVLEEVNAILNENKTLNDVVAEEEKSQTQKENEEALNSIIEETTKDLPSTEANDVKADAVDNSDETNKLDEELKK